MNARHFAGGLALVAFHTLLAAPVQAATAGAPERALVEQKHALVARILADSAKAESNVHIAGTEAKRQLTKATAMHERAKVQLEKGEIAAADRSLNDAMRLISKVRNQAADTDLRRSAEQSKYSQLMQSVETLESSYFRNVERRSAWLAEVGDEDLKRVKILVNRAKAMASSGKYADAIATLVKAQRDMVSSYNGLLGTAPLIYDLHFATAQEEYKYESERVKDYEGLVPVAIVDYKPSRESVATIERLAEESRALATQARVHAEKGQFQFAIQSQREAIVKLQRALEVAGIVVPQRIPN
jgi:tetratricopeptide (TPR) repeat protein